MKNLFYKRRFVFIPLAIAACLALVSFVVMTLWNNLLPGVMNVNTITFWQAMGIFILSKILFGFGKGGGSGPPWMKHKCGTMNPEAKEKFRAEMKERMCGWQSKDHGNIKDTTEQPNS